MCKKIQKEKLLDAAEEKECSYGHIDLWRDRGIALIEKSVMEGRVKSRRGLMRSERNGARGKKDGTDTGLLV